MKYPLILYPCKEGGYVAEIPTLKGCIAQGETIKECLKELEQVEKLWIASAKRHHERLPNAKKVLSKIYEMSHI